MHDNAIHDLALAYWSELLSPVKRCVSNELQLSGESFG